MSKIEILAPVGSEEMLHAAVFSGADAVYLGFSGFNARTSAGNFDADSLKEAVRFCHVRGVKVHVALNTTVYGTELAQLADAVRAVAASGADAVICQDLAVAKLIGEIAPELLALSGKLLAACDERGAKVLKEGLQVVICGKPNVGKSSLLNALVGEEKAIVTDLPGTTRDTVEEKVSVGGVLLRLIDTAGIRSGGDAVEALGVERSREAAKRASLAYTIPGVTVLKMWRSLPKSVEISE